MPAPRPQTDLYDNAPTDPKNPYDAHDLIETLADENSIHEFKAEYGTSIVTAFARLEGHAVGFIANNGVIFAEAAVKGAHFIEVCEQRGAPLIFLQNTTGFMVGRQYEEGEDRETRREDGQCGGHGFGAEADGRGRGALSVRGIIPCVAARTPRAICGCGRMRALLSWEAPKRR